MRLRFAPSPTGQLHVGNARTALFNWLLARNRGGTFILRIEDTDRERSTSQSELSILEDLRWLGLDWDEGPDAGGAVGPYRQSERLDLYRAHADLLLDGGHAYHCFCSAEQLEADRQAASTAGQPPRYAGRCRQLSREVVAARLAEGESAVVRFRVPEQRDVTFDDLVRGPVTISTDVIGDPVLLRSDGHPAYNFAVVVDDGLMGVTTVVRGEDHIPNTPRQVLLYEAFGWTPPAFAHLSLVLGPDHAPLSKRHGATSVVEFRTRGYLPEALVNYLALVGWSPGGGDELLPLEELARRFSLDGVSHSAGVFDVDKLAWVNRHYLKTADRARLCSLSLPYLREAGLATTLSDEARAWLTAVLPMATDAVDRLDQVPARLSLIFHYDPIAALGREDVRGEFASDGAREVARALAEDLASAPPLADREQFRASAQRVREKTGQKGKALFHPIRVVLTGHHEGPELDLLVPAIDRGAALGAGSGLASITGCRARARGFVEALGMIVYGVNPVAEALKAGRVKRLLVGRRDDQRLQRLLALASQHRVPVERVDGTELDRRSRDGVHQGVVAEVSAARDYSVAELVQLAEGPALLVVLDSIEDPHNVGAILRSVDASGAHGVIRQTRHAAALDTVAAKASAGAVSHVPVADVVNIARAIDELKQQNVWVVGLAGDAPQSYESIDWTSPSAIVLGAEGSGMRRLVRESCDLLVSIPMGGHVDSLNVSVAAGVVLFEAARQRRARRV